MGGATATSGRGTVSTAAGAGSGFEAASESVPAAGGGDSDSDGDGDGENGSSSGAASAKAAADAAAAAALAAADAERAPPFLFGLVMSFEAGGSLQESLFPRRRSMRAAWPSRMVDKLRVLKEAASGLYGLHQVQMTHGDLKPDNVMLTRREDPHVRLADFGLATMTSSAARASRISTIQLTDEKRGTWPYMVRATSANASDSHARTPARMRARLNRSPLPPRPRRDRRRRPKCTAPRRPRRKRRAAQRTPTPSAR